MTSKVVLIDTNIVSYMFNENSLAKRYKIHLRDKNPVIAAQSIAELRFGAYRRNWGTKRLGILESFIGHYLSIYPNDSICTTWAKLRTEAEQKGRHISQGDAWIAATTLTFGVPLVTHNRKDFDFVPDLDLISESPA